MTRLAKILAAVSVALLTTAAASADDLRIAVRTETTSLDPHVSSTIPNMEILSNIFEPLMTFTSDMKIAPALATEWKAIDDKTWEFKLRRNVKWHDGSPFTADDVIYTWERVPELSYLPDPFGPSFLSGKAIAKIDDFTVRVTTNGPIPITPNDMTQIFIISKKNGQGMKPEDYNAGKAVIGTGPYKFAEFVKGDRLVLTPNADWWGGKPKWDAVTIKPIASGPSRVAALLSGQVDITNNVPTEDIARLKSNKNVVVSQGPSSRSLFLHLDSNRDLSPHVLTKDGKPLWPNPLRDWRVRKAFAKAIDRKAIVERIMEGNAVVATQLLPEGFFGYNPDLKVEPHDPVGAKKLLAEAGFPDGFNLRIHGTSDRYVNDTKIMQAVAQMLTQIGVKTEVVLMPISVYFSRQTNNKEFSVFLGAHNVSTGEPSAELNRLVHTTIPNTPYCCIPRGYSNPRADDLIEKANVTMNDVEREKLYREAIAVAINDVSLIPLHFQVNVWASRPGVTYNNRFDEMTIIEEIAKAQ